VTMPQGILDALFNLAPSCEFAHADDDQKPQQRWRRTIDAPSSTLAQLRAQYSDEELLDSQVLQTTALGERQLRPGLCQPGGVIMALRAGSDNPPFTLLTSRGALSDHQPAVFLALGDERTVKRVQQQRMLLLTPRLVEVASLEKIGFPVALGLGLSRMTAADWCDLDDQLANLSAGSEAEEPSSDAESAEATEGAAASDADDDPVLTYAELCGPPLLILVDYWGRPRKGGWSQWMRRTARSYAHSCYALGRPLANVWVWAPDADIQPRFAAVLSGGDLSDLQSLLAESLTSLIRVEDVLQEADTGDAAPPDFLQTRRELLQHLSAPAETRLALGDELPDLTAAFDEAVAQEIVNPLVEWSLHHHSPLVRAAGVQLAEVTSLLLATAPRIHAARSHQDSMPAETIESYLRLVERFGRLMGEITRCLKA